jgi:hypothetical protein
MFKRTEPIKYKRWKFESYLGFNSSWWSYYAQYKNNIDDIINSIENNQNKIDTISLPLLFNIRHCLELGFKANILDFQKLNTEIPQIKLGDKKSHSLNELFILFEKHISLALEKQIISEVNKEELLKHLKNINALKTYLSVLDESSFNFRYPTDINNNLNFSFNKKINICEIINLFYEIQSFFIFVYQGE